MRAYDASDRVFSGMPRLWKVTRWGSASTVFTCNRLLRYRACMLGLGLLWRQNQRIVANPLSSHALC